MKKYTPLICSIILSLNAVQLQAISSTSPTIPTNKAAISEKAQKLLDQVSTQLSKDFPYRLNLYKDGQIDKNKAGLRISETAQQFENLGLTGLLFYYKLYDHSMRVPHWHANAVEAGVVLNGKVKVTIWDGKNKPHIFTVEKNGTWLIPQASIHALENVGEEELDFLVVYNSPNAADRDFVTAWAALPDMILESSLGLSPDEIKELKKGEQNRLSHYDPSASLEKENISSPFGGDFSKAKPLYESKLGSIRRIDAETNPAMQKMALQKTLMNPDVIREPHWYTEGDTILFVNKGQAYFTMMESTGKVYNAIITPGDIIFIPVGVFHTYANVGGETLEIYEAFNASQNLSEVGLLSGAQHFHARTLSATTGLSKEVSKKILKKSPENYMLSF